MLRGQEMDSPRGRIYLMKAGLEGRIDDDAGVRRALRHLPRLHGVRNRMSVGRPLCAARSSRRAPRSNTTTRVRRRTPVPPLLFSLLPYPARLRLLALPLALVNALRERTGVLSLLPRRLRNLIALAPDVAETRAARHCRRTHAAPIGASAADASGC